MAFWYNRKTSAQFENQASDFCKNLSRHQYEPESALGSAIVECLQGVPKTVYLSAFRA